MSDHLKQRGLESRVHGLPPNKSVDLESYKGQHLPRNWNIEAVTGDVLMCEYADEAEGDGELVNRDGIFVNAGVTREMWRVAKIVLAGPGASETCQPGSYVMFPNCVGIPMTKFNGHNYIFLNEERVLAIVSPKNNSDVS